jgi:protein gp37
MQKKWVIVGGESGPGCRPMQLDWARDILAQCRETGVSYFMKQLGGHPDKRHDPADWPEDLRVQEFPE